MNELTTQARQLPDAIEDLSRFVLVGREKLNAVRAEIRAIEKVQLAAEVHEQKLQEAQEIAEAVLDAEAKLGELTSKIEKAVNQHSAIRNGAKSKKEQLEEIGINKDQASRYESLARHPEAIERAKANAKAEGRIVTRQDVFHDISNVEYPTRKQKAARELREAEKRVESYQSGKVADIEEAKQHKQDNKLIAENYLDKVSKCYMSILQISINADSEMTQDALKVLDKRDLVKLQDELQDMYRTILKIQRKVIEVIDEK